MQPHPAPPPNHPHSPLSPPAPDATLLLDSATIERLLRRMAHEIIEANPDLSRLALIGIPSRGVEMARRIAAFIEHLMKQTEGYAHTKPHPLVETGVIDVSMHRDDLNLRPRLSFVAPTHLPPDLEKRTLVLVDDVLYSGRTCRAAMDALSSFGRPACIQYAVLVDRGHRELPIRADFVGKEIPTSLGERIYVRLQSTDRQPDGVWIRQSRP